MDARSLRRSAATRLRVRLEQARAQALTLRFAGVRVHPRARLARGVRVDVAPGGRLVLGPCAVAGGTVIEVGPAGRLELLGDFVGPGSVVVARRSVRVGPGTLVAEMCVLRDSDHARASDGTIDPVAHDSAPVTVGAHCWLGARVTVLKGVSLGDGSTAGAGAVITRDVAAGSTVVGVPARALGG
jgi:serine acetyltransferase